MDYEFTFFYLFTLLILPIPGALLLILFLKATIAYFIFFKKDKITYLKSLAIFSLSTIISLILGTLSSIVLDNLDPYKRIRGTSLILNISSITYIIYSLLDFVIIYLFIRKKTTAPLKYSLILAISLNILTLFPIFLSYLLYS